MEDLPKLKAQGYHQQFHPGRPTDKPLDNKTRGIKKVNDVFDLDNPVRSAPNLFLAGMRASGLAIKVMHDGKVEDGTMPPEGLVELTRPLTEAEKEQSQQVTGPKYYWQPGRLLGPDPTAKANISDPEYDFIPLSEMDPNDRSATCSSHIQQHPRPAVIGVGWGGYDKFREWQLHGRQVKRDAVKYEHFSHELNPVLE